MGFYPSNGMGSHNIAISDLKMTINTCKAQQLVWLGLCHLITIVTRNVASRLKSSLHNLFGRHHKLVDRYEISISQMTMDLSLFAYVFFPLPLSRLLLDLTVYMSSTVSVLKEAGTWCTSGAAGCIPGFWWGPCCSSFVSVLCCVFSFVLFVFVLCLVYPMLLVFLDGPFLTAPSDPLKFTNDFYKAKPV